jgi:hypothetical protein
MMVQREVLVAAPRARLLPAAQTEAPVVQAATEVVQERTDKPVRKHPRALRPELAADLAAAALAKIAAVGTTERLGEAAARERTALTARQVKRSVHSR